MLDAQGASGKDKTGKSNGDFAGDAGVDLADLMGANLHRFLQQGVKIDSRAVKGCSKGDLCPFLQFFNPQ